jgi:endogenous inhibitor of DNA gyrase (YacG/DUF329 family)
MQCPNCKADVTRPPDRRPDDKMPRESNPPPPPRNGPCPECGLNVMWDE